MKDKLSTLVDKWIAWNKKEITGNQFAMEFQRLYHSRTDHAWFKDRIKTEMTSEER